MRARHALLAACAFALVACGGKEDPDEDEISLEGTRYAVLVGADRLSADALAAATPIDLPPAQPVKEWPGNQAYGQITHVHLDAFDDDNSATIGDGADFDHGIAPIPVASHDTIYAMDARGVISAHALEDIDTVRWKNTSLTEKDAPIMLGGGLFLQEDAGRLYAASGYGRVAAIDALTGEEIWTTRLGAPVRGAPASGDGIVLVLTANNQTIALRAEDGQTKWEHRGISENAGFFSTASPIVSEGTALVAYSSGEVVALRTESGNVTWADTLVTDNRTHAAGAFTGISAPPLVQDGVAYLVSAAGSMVANALLNGRPLWVTKFGSSQAVWGAGNMVFVLTPQHQLLAILKRSGAIRWVAELTQLNDDGIDITPRMFAPMLINDHVAVPDTRGVLHRFDATSGAPAPTFEIADDLAAQPIAVGGKLITVHNNAQLRITRP